jgi:CRP/FNR family transcriptional regulator, cyclic AMP receptor protein
MNPVELFRHEPDAISLSPGEILFQQGDAGSHMFVLLEGAAEVVVGSEVVEIAGPGALIGEMALIDQAPRTATVVAKESCRLAKIDERRFHFLIRQNPFFATHVMRVLTERLRRMDQRAAGR